MCTKNQINILMEKLNVVRIKFNFWLLLFYFFFTIIVILLLLLLFNVIPRKESLQSQQYREFLKLRSSIVTPINDENQKEEEKKLFAAFGVVEYAASTHTIIR